MTPSGLGKGLGSLIPKKREPITSQQEEQKPTPAASGSSVFEVPLNKIKENPRQPRQHFSSNELEGLISSIKEHGILQPLIVTESDGGYELIAGERRFRAAKSLGLKQIPVVIRTANEQEKLELALIENIQRQDLNAVEEALAYQALHDEFNLTHSDIAKRVGKSRSQVSNTMRLLDLDAEILQALREGEISQSHARTLLAEDDYDKRMNLFKQMLTGGLSVREAESRVSTKSKSGGRKKDPEVLETEKKLRELFGTKVEIKGSLEKGKVVIDFYSGEELLDLLDRLSD